MASRIKKPQDIVDAPYMIRAVQAHVTGQVIKIKLASAVQVIIPIASLGTPWTTTSKEKLANVRLQFGGSWLWWDDLDEGLVLDEILPTLLGIKPAAMLARLGRGTSTPKKAAAARAIASEVVALRKRHQYKSRQNAQSEVKIDAV
jgi:hypothetical protein